MSWSPSKAEFFRCHLRRICAPALSFAGVARSVESSDPLLDIRALRSIRQSVQNGQFLSSLIKQRPNALIASHAQERIERPFVDVIAAVLSMNETPTSQAFQSVQDRRPGHTHVRRNLGDGKWLVFKLTKSYAQPNEEDFQAATKRLTCRSIGSVHSSHDVDHQATEHQPLSRRSDPVQANFANQSSHRRGLSELRPGRPAPTPDVGSHFKAKLIVSKNCIGLKEVQIACGPGSENVRDGSFSMVSA